MAALVPITLTPQTIREAFVAQLTAKGIPNVVNSRVRPWGSEDTPGVNVFSPGSQSSSISKHLPRFEIALQIVCSATAVIAEGGDFADADKTLADAIDAAELAIKTAILGDVVFAASFKGWGSVSVQKGGSVDGERFRGSVRVGFTVIYNEQFELTQIGGYDDLDTIEVRTVPEGAQGTPTALILLETLPQ